MVDKSLVENGWNYHTLTEDIEFSADCAYKGIKIGYVYDAVFFDEQPTKLGDSIKQRLRWCKGNNQVFGRFGGKLLGGMFKRFTFQNGVCLHIQFLSQQSPLYGFAFSN